MKITNTKERAWISWDKKEIKDILALLHTVGVSLYGAKCYTCKKKIYWRRLGGVWRGKNGKNIFVCADKSCMLIALIEDDTVGDE